MHGLEQEKICILLGLAYFNLGADHTESLLQLQASFSLFLMGSKHFPTLILHPGQLTFWCFEFLKLEKCQL